MFQPINTQVNGSDQQRGDVSRQNQCRFSFLFRHGSGRSVFPPLPQLFRPLPLIVSWLSSELCVSIRDNQFQNWLFFSFEMKMRRWQILEYLGKLPSANIFLSILLSNLFVFLITFLIICNMYFIGKIIFCPSLSLSLFEILKFLKIPRSTCIHTCVNQRSFKFIIKWS